LPDFRLKLPESNPLFKKNRWTANRLLVSAILFLTILLSFGEAFSDLAEEVTIPQLIANQEKYDGHKVSVRGVVNGMRGHTGRRGSQFIVMNLGDPDCFCYVDVVLPPEKGLTPTQTWKQVLGTYYAEGMFGGLTFRHVIIADDLF
jgi:hypothetical protein